MAATARAWRDPDHPPRAEAIGQTLDADNRFTEASLAFAVNRAMHLLTAGALRAWVGERQARRPRTVGVLHAGEVPLEGLEDLLAVVLTGHRYVGALAPASPSLLPAFVEEVRECLGGQQGNGLPAAFGSREEALAAGAVIANQQTLTQDEQEGVEHLLLRPPRYGVAVLDGHEGADEREGLAQDALLFEGAGQQSARLIWAPADLSPDPYLDAFAAFRAVVPAHEATPGALQMQKAFLAASGQPHAYGEDLEFLVSKGPPEPQPAGHVRWVSYGSLGEVEDWLEAHTDGVSLVAAREDVAARLSQEHVAVTLLGEAHRRPLGWEPPGEDRLHFLARC